jgi:uncharacterized membrane protein HdeD (DUF308 family)
MERAAKSVAELHGFSTARGLPSIWGTLFVSGLLIALLGILAWVEAEAVGKVSVFIIGLIVAVDGILELACAFRLRGTRLFSLTLLSGTLSLVVGVVLLVRPLVGLSAVTLLLAGFFLASGLFRTLTGATDRYAGWGWDILYGAVAVAAGVAALAALPVSSLWIAGALLGAILLTRGIGLMGMSFALRRLSPHSVDDVDHQREHRRSIRV